MATNGINCCMVTQQFNADYWQGLYTADNMQYNSNVDSALYQLSCKNPMPLLQIISDRLIAAGMPYTVIYANIHDDDNITVWDDNISAMNSVSKAEHIHIIIHFAKTQPIQMPNNIGAACGVAPEFVEKPRSGRYSWDNMVAYLIHAKDPDKTQYSPDKVVMIAGDGYTPNTYMTEWAQHKDAWAAAAARKQQKTDELSIDWLRNEIIAGRVSRSEVMLTDRLFRIYAANSRAVDDAFKVRMDKRFYEAIRDIDNGLYKITVFFITGKSGLGKTQLAKHLIQDLQTMSYEEFGRRWDVCHSAATNPLDNYEGEDILFMDDVRSSTMTAMDWLKLLDPYNNSTSSARYHNKRVSSKVIIITSEKNPFDFFYFVKATTGGDRSEAMDQFIRRIASRVQLVDHEGKLLNYRKSDVRNIGQHIETVNAYDSRNGKPYTELSMSYGFQDVAVIADEGKCVDMLVQDVKTNLNGEIIINS